MAARARADTALAGWNPERWSILEALRAAILLASPDGAGAALRERIEDVFQYADEGESCALYKAIPLLPDGERFVARAAEGCRSNMQTVFESVACDNPYPARHFDDIAWSQLVIKAIFIGAPVWRVHGLDGRSTPELARMALDLADERRSAGRPVPPALWLCIGAHASERALHSIERELAGTSSEGRRACVLALARAGDRERLERLEKNDRDPTIADALRLARSGSVTPPAFAATVGGE